MRSKKQLSLIAAALAVHVKRWPWRQIIASDHGPPSSTTRHVLHILSLFMNDDGGCHPSQATIARRAALTTRAVKKHIAIAKRGYWLEVTERYSDGQSWRGNNYVATVPASLHPVVQRIRDHDMRALWINRRRGERRSLGGEPGSPSMGNDVPTNLISESVHESIQSVAAVDKSVRTSKSGAAHRSKDDLKNRSAEKGRALRAQIAGASKAVPTRDRQLHELSDLELATKVKKLRAIGQGDGDIRRALASQASAAQLTRVMKSNFSR